MLFSVFRKSEVLTAAAGMVIVSASRLMGASTARVFSEQIKLSLEKFAEEKYEKEVKRSVLP